MQLIFEPKISNPYWQNSGWLPVVMVLYQSGVVNPPGGTLPFGRCGVAADGLTEGAGGSSDTMTPGQPINSPVRGFTEKSRTFLI